MASTEMLIGLLTEALRRPELRRQLIRDFQELVWRNSGHTGEEAAWQILADLAYDLDFYEPDQNLRNEDVSYFGDERAELEILIALKRLRELGTPFPADA
jgi:hypothetical protein